MGRVFPVNCNLLAFIHEHKLRFPRYRVYGATGRHAGCCHGRHDQKLTTAQVIEYGFGNVHKHLIGSGKSFFQKVGSGSNLKR